MRITVYSPKNKVFDNVQAKSVYLPSMSGDMQILDDHVPALIALKAGQIRIETNKGNRHVIHVHHGYAQYNDNNMTIVIVQTALSPQELSAIEARAVKEKDLEVRHEDPISEREFINREQSEGHE